ncbi:MAG: ATP-binding cassette domain-containing protein [Phycisphaerales bacterium]|jgi:phospholipid/cholesterol/gamma-HCH transport system ATP-binding protein
MPPGKNDGPVLRVRGLRKSFDGREILRGIDLDVLPGETMVIMGGSGSGKSTLLRLMIGSLKSDAGSISMFEHDICGLTEEKLNQVRLKFGILFQSGALFNSMTVAENVALPLQEHTRLSQEIIDIQVKIKLEQVQLREAADLFPAQISGGMKKRAGLARAMALDPQLLFCDEPSAGLDPITSAQIDRLLLDLTKKLGIACVVVTHEMDSAFTIADRMAMLDKGRMLAVESKSWFERVRDVPDAEVDSLSEDEQIIHQFLRGSAEGPLSERQSGSDWEQDILGVRPGVPGMRSVEPSRMVPRTEDESVLQRLRRILQA